MYRDQPHALCTRVLQYCPGRVSLHYTTLKQQHIAAADLLSTEDVRCLQAFYSEKKKQFDISKVPDIYDSAKYDAIHNSELGLEIEPLYRVCCPLALIFLPSGANCASMRRFHAPLVFQPCWTHALD